MDDASFWDPEPLLATLARVFSREGNAHAVAILANAEGYMPLVNETSDWGETTFYVNLYLTIPVFLYTEIRDRLADHEDEIREHLRELLSRSGPDVRLENVYVRPIIEAGSTWRDGAKAWVKGEGVNNQARAHSDNIPTRECDGLLFRSQPEIYLYQAFKELGVAFAPLPVFLKGGPSYKRIEPDFVIIKSGVVMVVEVDGDTVHRETPAEAQARIAMLELEGANVQRVRASECDTLERAKACAARLMQNLSRVKAAR